jgi:threonine/homoserine/homoserine lactone efflux protein
MNLVVSYCFSFIGSLTPGTINLSVLHSGLTNKPSVGVKMAAAAAIVEYGYAWIAVRFESLITSNPLVLSNFELIAAVVITVLGLLAIWSARAPAVLARKIHESGFRRGLLLGILNPLSMPYWMGITAYSKSQGWIDLNYTVGLHSYLLGVSLGVFSLLLIVNFAARKLSAVNLKKAPVLKQIPGWIMLGLGIYAFLRYFIGRTP